MSVDLEPSTQLTFTRPFNQMVKEVLRIHNPNPLPVAFKVKTTTPRQYCVRPNSGRIEAGETVEVQVVLQPMAEDPPADYRCKDKFLVQSVLVTADRERLPLSELWQVVEASSKSDLFERKLRCAFLMPPGTPANQSGAETNKPATDQPAKDTSVRASGSLMHTAATSEDALVNSLRRELNEANETNRQLRERNERLQRELREARATIHSRRSQDMTRTSTKTKQADQVTLPLQTVVAIVLFSFFLGYWFF